MNKILKYIGIIAFMIFSFYYTEKIANFVSNKNPIKKEILKVKDEYNLNYVNAVIVDDTIIPGLDGLEVNVNRSFAKMKKGLTFNPNSLIFDLIAPKISLKDNLDKIIIKGNKNKNMVAIIIDNNEEIYNYSVNNNLRINAILNDNIKVNNNIEYINGSNTKEDYLATEKKLDKEKINKNLCLISYTDIKLCKEYSKYLIKENLILSSYNYLDIRNNITSGVVIIINNKATLDEFKLLIKEILFKDLEINYLSKVISEVRD